MTLHQDGGVCVCVVNETTVFDKNYRGGGHAHTWADEH